MLIVTSVTGPQETITSFAHIAGKKAIFEIQGQQIDEFPFGGTMVHAHL